MKKIVTMIALALVFALPTFAASPSSIYEEDLYGNSKATSTVKPQFEINAGFITGGKLETRNFGKLQTNLSRPYIDVIGGVRLGSFLFAGVGVGVQYAYGECTMVSTAADIGGGGSPDTWGAVSIPIYANVKGYISNSSVVQPYFSVSIGGHIVATSNFSKEGFGKLNGGLMMKFGAGMNISKFNFGIGLASQNLEWVNPAGETLFKAGNNAFYIEAGVAF